MRQKLAQLGSQTRFSFRGKFARYGYKRAVDRRGNEHYAPTLLLTNLMVKDGDQWKAATDHLWFNLTKGFWKLGLLKVGDEVQLNGRVNDYYKGYFTDVKQRDLKLSYPSKISRVNSEENVIPLPEEKNAIIGLIMNLEWKFYKEQGRPIEDYYLEAFRGCPENKKYDYGVKVHGGHMGKTWKPKSMVADWIDRECDERSRRQAKRREVGQVRGKEWLKDKESVKATILGILNNNKYQRKGKDRRIMAVIKAAGVTNDDQCRIIKNDVKYYLASLQ